MVRADCIGVARFNLPEKAVWYGTLCSSTRTPIPHVGSANEYGGTVQILPLSPRLKDVADKVMPSVMATYNNNYDEVCRRGFGLGLPHIYRDQFGRNEEYFICTADPKYFKGDVTQSTSAASALSWACKWIILCEMWLNGEIGDDVAMEGNY